MNYVRWFNEVGAGDVGLVGGKGASLGEMANAGFPVPPGFCVTTSAYRELLQATGLHVTIEQLSRQLGGADNEMLAAGAAEIRKLIVQQPIPTEIAGAIASAYRRLANDVADAGEKPVGVAIRSSATAEDLPGASFAGQQDSYLNVCGVAQVLEHVRRCWASLWTDRAVAYRLRAGFRHEQVAICAVVQAMVPAEVAGVLFTADPISGSRKVMVINASWGLGEAIVAGTVSPDTITVRKRDGVVIRRETGEKRTQVVARPDGGTTVAETEISLRYDPTLSDAQAAELAALAQRIEAHYGYPQDVEWALAGGKWYVLQSRPVTTLQHSVPPKPANGTALSVPARHEYSRAMFQEIFTEGLSPAFLSVVCPLLSNMLAFTFKTLGFQPPEGITAVEAFNGQPYFNVDYLRAALRPLPPDLREPVVAQMANPFGERPPHRAGRLNARYLRMALRLLQFMVYFPRRLPALLAEYQRAVRESERLDLASLDNTAIMARVRHLVFAEIAPLLNYDFLLIAAAGRANHTLQRLLAPTYGVKTEELLGELLSGVSGNVIRETNQLLWELSRQARADDRIAAALRELPAAELEAALERTKAGRAFLASLEGFLTVAGHRETHFDIFYPTWREDPTPVLNFVRGYLDAPESQDPAEQAARLVAARERRTREVLTRVRRTPQGRLVTAPLLRWLLREAQTLSRERDTMHFEWTRLFPALRRMLLTLGRRWSERGYLAQPEDVFFLTITECEEMALTPRPRQQDARKRRAEYEARRHGPWPERIVDGRQVFSQVEPLPAPAPGALTGVAGSPGSAMGTCRLIGTPQEFGKLQLGDILVAPHTNPSWTPLFGLAGGLVTESGGMLSHGAIVAREYGIPAVMSVRGAMNVLKDGQTVIVDGTGGRIQLVERVQGVPVGE